MSNNSNNRKPRRTMEQIARDEIATVTTKAGELRDDLLDHRETCERSRAGKTCETCEAITSYFVSTTAGFDYLSEGGKL
jgi:hypothetical protein